MSGFVYTDLNEEIRKKIVSGFGSIQTSGGVVHIQNIPFESTWKTPVDSAMPEDSIIHALLRHLGKSYEKTGNFIAQSIQGKDALYRENRLFDYTVWSPEKKRSNDMIFLFHGLNEKNWDKYWTWAHSLVLGTGKTVVLFPMAFHMNRAPALWKDPRSMQILSRERKELFPDAEEVSFANVALSYRLQLMPQRFFISGLQTYCDLRSLIQSVKLQKHPILSSEGRMDFFGYSIGAFLAEMLFLNNPEHWFDDSRMFLFCGGSTLDHCDPSSQWILDSEASRSVHRFLSAVTQSENEGTWHSGGCAPNKEEIRLFKSFLRKDKDESYRVSKWKDRARNIRLFGFSEDRVFPEEGLKNTFISGDSNAPVKMEIYRDEFLFRHENPFPSQNKTRNAANRRFNAVFESAISHFGTEPAF